MKSYITIQELRKPPFNITERMADNTLLEFLCETAYELINSWCRQDFEKEGATGSEVSKEVRGTGTVSIYLPKRLITLKEVITDGVIWTPDNFIVSPYDIRWKDTVDYGSARNISGGVFDIGVGIIQVKGVWGFDPTPYGIKYANGYLVQKIVKEGSISDRASSESIGDYSYSRGAMEGAFTNDPNIDNVLKQYRRVRIDVPV